MPDGNDELARTATIAVGQAEASSASPPAPGLTLGRYRLERELGAGGMGVVHVAFDPDLERRVALKVLRAGGDDASRRLLREARAMARLTHPNVVTVHEVGTAGGCDYVAMELVEGSTLAEWLRATRRDPREIVAAFIAAGRGLAAAHDAGIVHRDFKPHNVLRSTDGHIYVTDFGLARGQLEDGPELVQIAVPLDEPIASSRPRPRRDPVLDSPLTQTGVLIGTPAYMAPEQFAGDVPDPRADQFAFCVTAWQALTGERPFRGASVAELEAAVRAGTRHLAVDLPARLRAVLERGLDPSPEQRWPDMTALLAALSAAVAEPSRRAARRWWTATLAATVLAGGVAVLAYRAAGGPGEEDGCVPADEAFSSAWGPERRAQLRKLHQGEAVGPILLLDDLRRRWIRSYTTACEAERTPETEERVRCLLAIRDEAEASVRALLVPGAVIDVAELGSLTASMVMCDPAMLRSGPGLLGL